MFNYKKFSLPIIFRTFFSYSSNKTESPCLNSRYSQCLNCLSYLLPAVSCRWQTSREVVGNTHGFITCWFWVRNPLFFFPGSNDQPRFIGGRFLTLCWWIFSIVIVSSYTANMAATLTARLADDGIPTLDDVLRNADNSFFVEKESALHQVAMVENEKKNTEKTSEQTIERSGAREWSEQGGASEWVSKRANGRASGPVLQSVFLAVLDHSGRTPSWNAITDRRTY